MTDKLKNIVEEELSKLPKENREAILSLDWAAITEEIGRKYISSEEEGLNDLQVETFLVLVGLELPGMYAFNVEDNVGTTKEDAQKISGEVLQKVFGPINDLLLAKIKSGDRIKNASWDQNLRFILSGGSYASFIETKDLTPSLPDKEKIQNNLERTLGISGKLVI